MVPYVRDQGSIRARGLGSISTQPPKTSTAGGGDRRHARFLAWQEYAACGDADAMVFFSPDRERDALKAEREALAQAICATCPVTKDCLRDAVESRLDFGVFGGVTESVREKARKRASRSGQSGSVEHVLAAIDWFMAGSPVGMGDGDA